MRIRLWGTRGECAVAADKIAEVLRVVSVSDPYRDRGNSKLVRVYVEIRIPSEPGWSLTGPLAGPLDGDLP